MDSLSLFLCLVALDGVLLLERASSLCPLFHRATVFSLFLLRSLFSSLVVSLDLQARARHTSPLETKLPDATKADVRVRVPGTRGPIGCAAIETSNKTFLRAKPICRQAIAPFTTSHLPIETASLDFESVDR